MTNIHPTRYNQNLQSGEAVSFLCLLRIPQSKTMTMSIPKFALGFTLLTWTYAFTAQRPFPEVPETENEASTREEKRWSPALEPIPQAPDYHNPKSWALHPILIPLQKLDPPKGFRRRVKGLGPNSNDLKADVFFIHPTMLLDGETWNADVNNAEMNASVDVWPIRHQASAFSGAGRVFAPRYRQAHVRIFSLGDSLSWAAAEIAYQDVKTAFLHFLEASEGNPIVLAGHSQGSFHGRRLLQEFFDGTIMSDRLVAAYFPGMDMYAHEFDALPVCQEPSQTGCLCTWMTYGNGYLPPWLERKMAQPDFTPVLITHPVTWKASELSSTYASHLGVVRPSFRLSKAHAIKGHIAPQGVLWVDAPKVLGGKILQRENWHSGDINLFWVNIYDNVQTRTREWAVKRDKVPTKQ